MNAINIKIEDIENKFSHCFEPRYNDLTKIDWNDHKIELRHFIRAVRFDMKLELYYNTFLNDFSSPTLVYYVNLGDIEKVKKHFEYERSI